MSAVKWIGLTGWNVYSTRFVDPPTWTWNQVPGVASYRVRMARPHEPARSFEATQPWFSMAACWAEWPAGPIDLVVEGYDGAGREVCMPSWPKRFYKVPGFDGVKQEPLDWRGAVRKNIAYLLAPAGDADEPYERGLPRSSWSSFEDTATGQRFRLAYPASNHPSFVMAFVRFAEAFADDPLAQEALRQARQYGDWLLENRFPADWACGLFPYSTSENGQSSGGKEGQSITLFRSAFVAEAMLSLYEAFGDDRYLDYARHLAESLIRMQRTDGSWPYRVNPQDGSVTQEYTSDTVGPARLLAKLEAIKADGSYREARRKAIEWMLQNPVKTRLWQGQFEDFGENTPYENLEHVDSDELVRYLVVFRDQIPGAVDIAEDLNRYTEDQFVVWQREESPVPVECPTPTVLEQYLCYWPMEINTGYWILSLMALHEATRKQEYIDKAVAAANAILQGQYENGAFSTWGRDWRFGRPLRTDDWPAGSAVASEALLYWDQYYQSVQRGESPGRTLLRL